MSTPYDVAIIGGGIVGNATALALSENRDLSIIILEAEARLAAHQTGNNSGVIHSGLYYAPGSLKARTCTEGREALYRFCEEHEIPCERCGKVVVAAQEEEIPTLQSLIRRGTANGLKDLRLLDGDEIREYEPHVDAVAGTFVEETGIVDFTRVTETMAEIVNARGGEVRFNAKVVDYSTHDNVHVLHTPSGEVRSRNLVNCAGLQSDRVARMCGADPDVRIVPFRGEYYELIPASRNLVNNLIYPVPNPEFPFLGVHFTRMIDGSVEAGPNAVLALKREGYTRTSFSLKDTYDTFTYPGFWKLIGQYWFQGMHEYYRSFSKRAFSRALQRLIPEVNSDDLEQSGAGVRAQALAPDGNLLDDFRILRRPGMIHVLNAPSPAATASLKIGETIAGHAQEHFRTG